MNNQNDPGLEELIGLLTVKERDLLERRFLKEDSYEDIAGNRGWSVANTRQKISRLFSIFDESSSPRDE